MSPQPDPDRGASPAGEAARTRALRWGLWGCTTILIVLVALMVIVASIAYIRLGEPDSDFPERLAVAAEAAGDGGMVRLSAAILGPWDAAHLFAPGTDAAAIEDCLGFAWDKTELVADHLTADAPGAFVVVKGGAVADYGWRLGAVGFTDWPCGVTPGDETFAVAVAEGAVWLTRATGE